MKKLYLSVLFLMLLSQLPAQIFQKNFQIPNHYFHTVFTGQLNNPTKDLVVMGSLYDNSFSNPEIQMIKISKLTGNIIGQQVYYDPTFTIQAPRVFDFVTYDANGMEIIAMTGSVTVSNRNYAFIAKISEDGNFMEGVYYDNLLPDAEHSQGLHIIRSQGGFVVAGFSNMDYNSSTNDSTWGFVLKTDDALSPVWCKKVWTNLSGATQDYDMVNNILETDYGYFVTGSVTSLSPNTQQAVLCLQMDFSGNYLWSQSYVLGNSRDVSVDAYYDQPEDEIFVLCNYSITDCFGVTVLNAYSGTIDFAKSWMAYNWNDLDIYAFSIFASARDEVNNLVISGYKREGQVLDQNGVLVYGQTIPFVYEFEKSTGDQVDSAFYYHVAYQQPPFNDYFDFWNAQMPLIYYPDMSLKFSSSTNYFHVAYRTDSANDLTNIEMIKTDPWHFNPCNRSPLNITHDSLSVIDPATTLFTNELLPDPMHFELSRSSGDYNINKSCQYGPCIILHINVSHGYVVHIVNHDTASFTPVSLDAAQDSVFWNFGDGNYAHSAGNQTVTHVFPLADMYDVCMVVTRTTEDGIVCQDSICEPLDLTGLGNYSIEAVSLKIGPNPVRGILHISGVDEKWQGAAYKILNLTGQIVMEGTLAGNQTMLINTGALNNGMYLLQIQLSDRKTIVRKFVKNR
jgi:hypothetical protein